MIKSEQQLASLCAALLPRAPEVTLGEWSLIRGTEALGRDIVESTRTEIAAGGDPIGELFLRLRPAEKRRALGATYTPNEIISAMVRWSSHHDSPTRIVDPGAGSGRFLLAAADAFPDAKLVGIECDPLAALMLRANLESRGLSKRATVLVEDYRKALPENVRGRSLFIGNPPYVRHHQIDPKGKAWFGKAAKELDVPASKLAGLHIHFFLRTAQLAKPGDIGTFVTSSEWLDVNYGVTLRRLLTDRLGGVSLHVLDAKALPFADTMTTATITCFRPGERTRAVRVQSVKNLDRLNGLQSGKNIDRQEARKASRWSIFLRAKQDIPSGFVELGELCRVHRGQVTGSNAVWIEGPHSRELPTSVLFPAITKGRELLAAGHALTSASFLRRVVDLPEDLDALGLDHRRAVMRFLEFARRSGAHESYIARHRRAWWSVGLKKPAPILVSYMARRAPSFTRNLCDARHINIAHGLYPRQRLSSRTLDALAGWLRGNVRIENGRIYAGGLVKFEPREIERIPIPPLYALSKCLTLFWGPQAGRSDIVHPCRQRLSHSPRMVLALATTSAGVA